jgi:hypothetical protein
MRCAVVAAMAAAFACAAPAAAASNVYTCPGRPGLDTGGIGSILSVRNMTCAQAASYYRRHRGDQHVPISTGVVKYIGKFRCSVYQDLTPPGPSDTWVRIRCTHSRQAFRVEYGV